MKTLFKSGFETTHPWRELKGLEPDAYCLDLEFEFMDKHAIGNVNLVFDLTKGMANTQDLIHFQIMQILTHVFDLAKENKPIFIRTNWLTSSRGRQDVELLTQRFSALDLTLVLTALHDPSELKWLRQFLLERDCGHWQFLPTLETATALVQAAEFIQPGVVGLVFDKRFIDKPINPEEIDSFRESYEALNQEKRQLIEVAKQAGLPAWDMSLLPIHEPRTYQHHVHQHLDLGFDGFVTNDPVQLNCMMAVWE